MVCSLDLTPFGPPGTLRHTGEAAVRAVGPLPAQDGLISEMSRKVSVGKFVFWYERDSSSLNLGCEASGANEGW